MGSASPSAPRSNRSGTTLPATPPPRGVRGPPRPGPSRRPRRPRGRRDPRGPRGRRLLVRRNERDSRTPLVSGQGLRRVAKGARLVTVLGGQGHGVHGSGSRADATATACLTTTDGRRKPEGAPGTFRRLSPS
ncbi:MULTISPECIES: alpha/beta hydrolase [unclassified Streptomyces]|uniref:alpha/beta hydrolase n=1 Tax=unclassified Streptomyces TaxID=2593676 RepID=UPI0036F8A707